LVEHSDDTVTRRDIPDWPGYQAGDDGSIWSAWRHEQYGRTLTDVWHRLTLTVNCGYLVVGLRRGSEKRLRKVHQLVLEAFVGPRPSGQQGCHRNGVATDCRLQNLRWDTPAGNAADTVRRGERNGFSLLSEAEVVAAQSAVRDGAVQASIARQFGVSPCTINAIVKGRSWKHVAS
jgi:hypothetical protein